MTPELVDAFSAIGLTGGAILAVWAFAAGRVVTAKALADCEARAAAEVARERAANDALRAELREVAREAPAAMEKQLAAAADQVRLHQEERSEWLRVLSRLAPPEGA